MSDYGPVRDWWTTEIINVRDGNIELRGYPIEQLIGNVTFVEMIWLLLRGEVPSRDQATLLEAAMVASVNAGPMSPSCSIASMAITCGVGLNNAIASGINALGDTHGGAGQQCMELYDRIAERWNEKADLQQATADELDSIFASGQSFIPGYGHRFHSVDPRSVRLLELADKARDGGHVSGRYAAIARAIEADLERRKGKRLPINVDGSFAVILAELGFAPPLGRGVFVLARSVGLLAHAWEQMQEGRRIKGPVPADVMFTYAGPETRSFERP